jgi:hypothetical protein
MVICWQRVKLPFGVEIVRWLGVWLSKPLPMTLKP